MTRVLIAANILLLAICSQQVFSSSVGEVVKTTTESLFSSEVFKNVRLQFVMPHTVSQSQKVKGEFVSAPDEGGNLWAEFHVVSSKEHTFEAGQTVFVRALGDTKNDSIYRRRIDTIVPSPSGKNYQVAKINVHKSSVNSAFSAGQSVEAKIVTNEFRVDVAVEKTAVLEMNGKRGVFVLKGEKFEFVPLALGREGDIFVEVLSGVQMKMIYATENASLIKAEFEAPSGV